MEEMEAAEAAERGRARRWSETEARRRREGEAEAAPPSSSRLAAAASLVSSMASSAACTSRARGRSAGSWLHSRVS
jgi:hypothetical protein